MRDPDAIKNLLCRTFCSEIEARAVPAGIALSTIFSDNSGDRIGFYLLEDQDGFVVEDDGQYLSELIGLGLPINQGMRGQLLDSILNEANAYWDQDTFEIRTGSFPESEVGERLVQFVSALIRVRDLQFLTREAVRSTFREDAITSLNESFGDKILIQENAPISKKYGEYPVDIIVRPRGHPESLAAVYLATTNDKLNEALLFRMELEATGNEAVKVFALIEEPEMKLISRRVFQRAQNRSLAMPIFRGDESAAMGRIGREVGVGTLH